MKNEITEWFNNVLDSEIASSKGKQRVVKSQRDANILKEVFNFSSSTKLSQTEIAEKFNLSNERIRQLKVKKMKAISSLIEKDKNEFATEFKSFFRKLPNTKNHNELSEFIFKICKGYFPEENLKETSDFFVRLLSKNSTIIKDTKDAVIAHEKTSNKELKKVSQNKIKLDEKIRSFLSSIVFPGEVKIFEEIDFNLTREPLKNEKANSGFFYSSKTGRNLQYEALQEKSVFEFLESRPEIIDFIEQPVKLQNGEDIYTPDLAVLLNSGEIIIIEVKQLNEMVEGKVLRKLELLSNYCKTLGYGFTMIDANINSYEKLLSRKVDRVLETFFENRFKSAKSSIFYDEYQTILQEFNCFKVDVQALFLQKAWYYRSFPVLLSNSLKKSTEKFVKEFLIPEGKKKFQKETI